jgi:hypothetical protein
VSSEEPPARVAFAGSLPGSLADLPPDTVIDKEAIKRETFRTRGSGYGPRSLQEASQAVRGEPVYRIPMDPAMVPIGGVTRPEPVDVVISTDVDGQSHQLSNWDLVLYHQLKRTNPNFECFAVWELESKKEWPVFPRLSDPRGALSKRLSYCLRHGCGKLRGDRKYTSFLLSPRGMLPWRDFLNLMGWRYQEREHHTPYTPKQRFARRAYDFVRLAAHSEKGRFRLIVPLFRVPQGHPAWLWGTPVPAHAKDDIRIDRGEVSSS